MPGDTFTNSDRITKRGPGPTAEQQAIVGKLQKKAPLQELLNVLQAQFMEAANAGGPHSTKAVEIRRAIEKVQTEIDAVDDPEWAATKTRLMKDPAIMGAMTALQVGALMAPSQMSGMMGMSGIRRGVGNAVSSVGKAITGSPAKTAEAAETAGLTADQIARGATAADLVALKAPAVADKVAGNPGWWAKVTDPKRVAKGIAGATLVGAAGSAGLVGVQATYNKMRDWTGVQGREDQKIMAQQQGQTDLARIAAEDTANQKVIAGKIELGKEKLSNEKAMYDAKMEMLKGQMNAATAIFQNSATQAINYLPRMPNDLYSGLGIAPLPQYAQPTQQPSMAP